jgi:cation:H+ antiporter
MVLDVALLVLGGAMLYFGAEWLVNGAASLALALGMRPLVIGLTIVSYGTSAPELAVSVIAAVENKPEIAIGNVIGSNVANIGLILGLTALIAPPRADGAMLRSELPALALATLALPLVLWNGAVGPAEALTLLIGSVLFTLWTLKRARGPATTAEEAEPSRNPASNRATNALLLLVGLAVLVGGGEVFVTGASNIARAFGMSELLVGLTVVAIGTSLPELATSLMAALKGHPELALGNIVGSNIFNILLILGVAGLVRPIPGSLDVLSADLIILGALTVGVIVSLGRPRTVPRWEGGGYLAIYVFFLVQAVIWKMG